MQADLLSRLPAALQRAGAAVAPAIRAAAAATGADFRALFETARLESGFRPDARARTSSAAGLFQFLDSTWLAMLARHGSRHGIAPQSRAEALALREDPQVAALMAGAFMAENGARLAAALGRAASATDLYLAHFLGPGGAVRFLKALADDPGAPGAALFPAAAKANRGIFFAGGAARSLGEIHALLARRLGLDSETDAPVGEGAGSGRIGTAVPESRPRAGSDAPERGAPAMFQPRDASDPEARRAAQAAYLLLASLGA